LPVRHIQDGLSRRWAWLVHRLPQDDAALEHRQSSTVPEIRTGIERGQVPHSWSVQGRSQYVEVALDSHRSPSPRSLHDGGRVWISFSLYWALCQSLYHDVLEGRRDTDLLRTKIPLENRGCLCVCVYLLPQRSDSPFVRGCEYRHYRSCHPSIGCPPACKRGSDGHCRRSQGSP
jgi:hypothetical protein